MPASPDKKKKHAKKKTQMIIERKTGQALCCLERILKDVLTSLLMKKLPSSFGATGPKHGPVKPMYKIIKRL